MSVLSVYLSVCHACVLYVNIMTSSHIIYSFSQADYRSKNLIELPFSVMLNTGHKHLIHKQVMTHICCKLKTCLPEVTNRMSCIRCTLLTDDTVDNFEGYYVHSDIIGFVVCKITA